MITRLDNARTGAPDESYHEVASFEKKRLRAMLGRRRSCTGSARARKGEGGNHNTTHTLIWSLTSEMPPEIATCNFYA